jgi:hypothetical protein
VSEEWNELNEALTEASGYEKAETPTIEFSVGDRVVSLRNGRAGMIVEPSENSLKDPRLVAVRWDGWPERCWGLVAAARLTNVEDGLW